MNIIVTGAAGMIGSHLCDRLLEEGHTVTGVDNLSFGKKENVDQALKSPRFTFVYSDVCNGLELVPKSWEADLIIHLASFKKAPLGTIRSSNILINNHKMLHQCIKHASRSGQDKKKILFTSTSDVYGNSKTFVEDEPITIGPPTIRRYSYALSKLYGEQLLLNCIKEGIVDGTIIRLFGVYSERSYKDWSGGHIPVFIDNALNGKDIIVHGDGLQKRSMSYIDDCIDALILVINGTFKEPKRFNGEIINVGSKEQVPIRVAAELIRDLCGNKVKIIHNETAHGNYKEIMERWANTEKLQKLTGYTEPKVSFEEGIEKIIKEWSK